MTSAINQILIRQIPTTSVLKAISSSPLMTKRTSDSLSLQSAQKRSRPCTPCTTTPPPPPRYDFEPLLQHSPDLQRFAIQLDNGRHTIDFSKREATLALTTAILRMHFNLRLLLPSGHLIPTIPNRVQYLQWVQSLIISPQQPVVQTLLDLGTGPSAIYVMLGARLFPTWQFIGVDNDPHAVQAARQNVQVNVLSNVTIHHNNLDSHLIPPDATIAGCKPTLTVCNPPFHETCPVSSSPAGTSAQLATAGGELAFLRRLALESRNFPTVQWFTSLLGRKVDLPKIVAYLRSPDINAVQVKTVQLAAGGRTVRWAVAWSFGSHHSVVEVHKEEASSLRARLVIMPGRVFANQLKLTDIADIVTFAFLELNWSDVSSLTKAGSSGCERAYEQPANEDRRSAEIRVLVLAGSVVGQFVVQVKIHCRAELDEAAFEALISDVASLVRQFLNESDE